jgi:hypothetical protein
MTHAGLPHFTQSGLPGIELIPYGMHICQFYRDRDELAAALVPYFVAGLSGKERCLWITAPPLPAADALQAIRAAWIDTDEAVRTGALRILDFDRWYGDAAGMKGLGVVEFWLSEEERALAAGYNGLRIAGNTSFVDPGGWSTFLKYEKEVTRCFNGRRIVALCNYARAQCDDRQVSDVMHAHHCALDRPDSEWRVVTAAQV